MTDDPDREVGRKPVDRPTRQPDAREEDTFVGPVPVCVFQPPPPQNRRILLRLDGADAGQLVSVRDQPLLVGRTPTAHVLLRDKSVSRRHAQLLVSSNDLVCTDLDSRHGTHVNGIRQKEQILRPGDIVQFGEVARFVCDSVSAEQEEVLLRLRRTGSRDGLTEAHTRQYFDERLASECGYANRHESPLSIVLFDLDHFKRVNDKYGHQVGDAVLRHVAGLAHQRLRREDVFARYGGEEFVVLLRHSDVKGAFCVAERLRAAVATRPVFHESAMIAVTLSAGCAAWEETERKEEQDLIRLADERLYRAKAEGRNRVVAAK